MSNILTVKVSNCLGSHSITVNNTKVPHGCNSRPITLAAPYVLNVTVNDTVVPNDLYYKIGNENPVYEKTDKFKVTLPPELCSPQNVDGMDPTVNVTIGDSKTGGK